MDNNLAKYVGRSFRLQKTKYGELDGQVAKVTELQEVPWALGKQVMLIARVEGFPADIIVSPQQFSEEVA